MSEETLAMARRGYDAWTQGDLDGFLTLLDPDIEIYPDPTIPGLDDRVWQGREGMLMFLEHWLEPWSEFRLEVKEFIDVGDQVVVLLDQVGLPTGSTFEVKGSIAHLWTMRNGLAVRFASYLDQADAFKAAGLGE